jgi:hypothetical protein
VQRTTNPTEDEKARVRLDRQQMLADVAVVMGSPAGRRTIWRWLSAGRVFGRCFQSSAAETFYREGRREMANQIYAEVREASLKLYRLMEDEHQDELGEDNGQPTNPH